MGVSNPLQLRSRYRVSRETIPMVVAPSAALVLLSGIRQSVHVPVSASVAEASPYPCTRVFFGPSPGHRRPLVRLPVSRETGGTAWLTVRVSRARER